MSFSSENIAELNLLLAFDLSTSRVGIKIHKTASSATKAAASSLFDKGFTSQVDGGYLTSSGITAAEHAQSLFMSLNPSVL
ncbi:MAG: TIGR02647 family protein [Gammaproteobacteria bacterium]|nr:TIGR02647 family protein [Gammaproteobacteria bacterium]